MLDRRHLLTGAAAFAMLAINNKNGVAQIMTTAMEATVDFKTLGEADWQKRLTPEQFYVMRKHGTERPFTSPLNKEKRKGTFACAGCELPLFASDTKFESGTGWPSFWKPLDNAIGETKDTTFGMTRTEVHCRRCGGHMGHVFEDGPQPTGLRYCIDGFGLVFHPAGPQAS